MSMASISSSEACAICSAVVAAAAIAGERSKALRSAIAAVS
jgi:hypothetical protein